MSAITGAIIGGVGLYQKYRAGQKAKRLSKEDARLQGIISEATLEQSEYQSEITKQQEQLRREEATANSTRARRNVIRQGQIARANAVTAGARSGALDSSSLQGGLAQIGASTAGNVVAINEAFERGETNFDLNEQLIDSQDKLNRITGGLNQQRANVNSRLQGVHAMSDLGSSLLGIGGTLMSNSDLLSRVGGVSSGGGDRISIGGGL